MDTKLKCNYGIEWCMYNKILLLHHFYCRCVWVWISYDYSSHFSFTHPWVGIFRNTRNSLNLFSCEILSAAFFIIMHLIKHDLLTFNSSERALHADGTLCGPGKCKCKEDGLRCDVSGMGKHNKQKVWTCLRKKLAGFLKSTLSDVFESVKCVKRMRSHFFF